MTIANVRVSLVSPARNRVETELGQDCPEARKSVPTAIADAASRLARLPRVTREFLAMLYERREDGVCRRFPESYSAHYLYKRVEREYRGDDWEGELELLTHAGFASVDFEGDSEYLGPAAIGLRITAESDDLAASFVQYVLKRRLDFRRVVGAMDFSDF